MSVVGRVLLVDSHAGFRNTLVGQLRRRGLACEGLGDPREAAEVLRRGRHDVLVVDVGSAGNRRLLLRNPSLPVIAVARRPSVETALAALRARAVDYLTKPIRLPVLLRSIQVALQKAHALRGVRHAERLITLWAEWIRLLDAILSAPGRAALPARLLSAMAREHPPLEDDAGPSSGAAAALSPREQEVLLAFGSGLRVRQIARALGVSVHTARAHLKAIMRKLSVHSQSALLERLHAPGPRTEDADAHR